jgi:hypothetical protein
MHQASSLDHVLIALKEKGLVSTFGQLSGGARLPKPRRAREDSQAPDFGTSAQMLMHFGRDLCHELLSIFEEEILPISPCVGVSHVRNALDSVFRREEINPFSMEITKAIMGISLSTNRGIKLLGREHPLQKQLESCLDWSLSELVTGDPPLTGDVVLASLLVIVFILRKFM